MNKYVIDFIRENSIRVLREKNITGAEIIVDSMISADISGIQTHGIKMLPSYISKFDKGEFGCDSIEILNQTASFTVVDAHNSIGSLSAVESVDIAIEKAREYGMHSVFARNCNTLGPAFYYAERISKAGLIGFVCCNSPAAMPVNNGLEVMLGTNPFAFACPSQAQGTILVDMATSVVAKSKFLAMKNKGEKLPEGWALDKNGNATTDPDEAIKGLVLPMAGPKGYGIALIIDIVSGMLSGAAYLNTVGKFYSPDGQPMNVGHFFVAIDPVQVYGKNFYSEMDNYIEKIRNSKPVEGMTITIPGDGKYSARKKCGTEGIMLPSDVVKKLEGLFGKELIPMER